ncbi:EmrB/QacA subfamily drug resistance transporter [Thermocatellispora tengchongensis]|uniref:EmrB/QacA subfamily drug resistance transporter n=1 Tax=Thermocatellispora tengchongensis TaxID=1073253 RepID=A0A840PRF2_9ACTN|nr:MFS transporter [Thermocatellispora tengchongensis]MBB5138545.1 EmrB/QacA subfamily drug resistance transporter [Thermocatellispora tengchongensis]
MSQGAEQEKSTARLAPEGGSRAYGAVLVLACLGQFMVVLDVSIVNIALPAIKADLGFDDTGLQWVVNAYSLTFAGLLLLGGRIADLAGRKRVFVAGVTLFTVSSLLGGLADTPGLLIAARVVQGLGAAVLAPATLTILTTTFTEGPRRTRAIASWTAVGAVGGAVGGILGGVLTEYLSWRWILLINVPVGVAIVAAAVPLLAESRVRLGGGGLDVLGTILVTSGISLVAFGTVQSETYGWAAWQTLAPLATGTVALGAFLLWERRLTGRGRTPLVPLHLLRSRQVAGGTLVMLITGAAYIAMWYFMSLHMQVDLGYTPVQTGLAFIPHTLTMMASSRLSARLMPRFGRRTLVAAGSLIGAAGFAWQAVMAGDYVTGVLLPGLVMCFGGSLAFTPAALAGTSGAGPGEAGLLSGLLNTSRQVGGSLGLAALATVAAAVHGAPAAGYSRAFIVGTALLLLSAIVAMAILPRERAATR